ncbi:hypothetical protein DQ04_06881040 [Trypanosoma grayi]|uniref:hypothetical protein n=1 Tax=Trypanosoma grayi TaxID=71804 RepID=UPI0004F49507|nr:hypothetical protein DQ04_06881040 [Trypanosoma grayi]KEG08578.1 hypothetical protein DQ04_06881040 [Trypanosoma grayi]
MGFQTPWVFIAVAGVPLFMIYTKAKRIDAKEMHEVQMRIKYHSEFWARGNDFVRAHSGYVQRQLCDTADAMLGVEITGSTDSAAAAATAPATPWWRLWRTNQKVNNSSGDE